MIRQGEFERIQFQVERAVKEVFVKAQSNQQNNDFALFLCNAQYVSWDVTTNPYWVDYRMDSHHDEFRLNFLFEYVNNAYSFRSVNTSDSGFSITLELMIYTHMWESRPYLKLLKRLADFVEGKPFNWNVEVPDFTRHDFIRKDIRDVFKSQGLGIHEIITNGYHSQLRNAFAHSDYMLEFSTPKIELLNYDDPSWQIRNISFDDWTKRFCNTFLLGYEMHKQFYETRTNLSDGTSNVILKNKDGTDANGILIYDKKNDSFQAKIVGVSRHLSSHTHTPSTHPHSPSSANPDHSATS